MTKTQDDASPVVPKPLLEYLQRHYPEQSPRISWTEREIWMKAGQCELVRVLEAIFEEQNTALLAKPTS